MRTLGITSEAMDVKQIEKVKSVISEQGHDFHFEVVEHLRKRGWSVIVSPYYSDAQTNLSREIDIIATREDQIASWPASQTELGLLKIRLFIECKYIKEPTVFWRDNIDKEAVKRKVVAVSPHEERDVMTGVVEHHYLREQMVAKLAASSKAKETENEPFFKALNQVLHGMFYWSEEKGKDRSTHYTFRSGTVMPVILCKNFSNCVFRDPSNSDGFVPPNSPFLFETNYAYIDKTGTPREQ